MTTEEAKTACHKNGYHYYGQYFDGCLVCGEEIPTASIDKRSFPGGSVRDSNKGKPRYDLIPPEALLRVAIHYATGAEKYGVDNWLKGEGMPREAFVESAFRHFEAVRMRNKDEDHAAACIWNLLAIMYFEERGRDV